MSTFIKAGFWEKLCKPCKGYKGWLNLDEFVLSLIPPTPAPTYKVFTALLTQSGENIAYQVAGDGGNIIQGTTYYINDNPDNFDLTIYGAPNNDVGTYFIANQSIGLPYTYTLLLQANSGVPVATVLENTIGNIWFTYNGTGQYSVNSDGLFVENKSMCIIGSASEGVSNGALSSVVNGGINIFGISTAVIISGFPTPFNDELQLTPIEIRVYN